jgi:hypothetical protein
MTNGFDKLLRESLAAEAADGNGGDCPDAAIVAGWFDGTLSHAERTAVEAHAATCARCQATIAALVRTDRPAPRAWWRAPAVQWLVPVAVAAGASLIIWIGVLRTDDEAVPPPSATSARLESADAPARTPESAVAKPGAVQGGQAQGGAADPSAKTASLPDADTRARAEQRAGRALANAKSATAEPAKAVTPPVDALQPQATATALPQQASESASRQDAPSPPPPAVAGGVATPPPASVAPRAELTTAAMDRAGQSKENAFVQSVAAAAGRGGGRLALIQSPDLSVRWRITGQSQVERSADGGLSWQTQATGVNAVLVAGVAPSSTVCWLVGWRGVVLKTTDGGQTWTRVAFPEEINLVGVVADDDKVATVTAAGGRQVHTTDGGGRWR